MSASITWHGHANFQVTAPEYSVIVDPFFLGNPSAVTTWNAVPAPDLVLVTHLHADHVGETVSLCQHSQAMLGAVVGAAEKIRAAGVPEERIVNGIGFNIGGTVTVKGVRVTMTEAFHTTDAGAPAGFIITLPGGFTIYHAGDTGIFANMAVWGELYPIDLALLPVGGVFTMDARQGALAAKLLGARAVVPMHWGTFPMLAQDTQEFQAELAKTAPGCRFVGMKPGDCLSLPGYSPCNQ